MGSSVTVENLTTNRRLASRSGDTSLLHVLSHTLRQINSCCAPHDMIHITLIALYDICCATRVSFDAPDRQVSLPTKRSTERFSREGLSFLVPEVAPPTTITVELAPNTTLQPDVLRAVQALTATLGAALKRAVDKPSIDRTVTLAHGNALSETLIPISNPDDICEFVVEWIGIHLNAEHCLLFNTEPEPVQFPCVLPKTHVWSRPGAERPPRPTQLFDDRNTADHLCMTRLQTPQGPAMALAVCRDAGEARWGTEERDLVYHLATVVELHLDRANRQRNASHRSRTLQAVQKITAMASGAADLGELCRLMHDAVGDLIQHDTFLIALRPPGQDVVTMIYRAEGDTVFPQRSAIPQVVNALELARPLVIDDILEGAVSDTDRFGDPGKRVRSVVSAPLMSKGAPIGLIVAQSYEPGFYSWETAGLLQSIALSVVGTFERLMLLEQIERQTRRDIGLRSVAERLGQTLDTEELITVASEVIFDTVMGDMVMVLVIDRQTNRVRSASYRSVDPEFEAPPAGHVMRQQSLTYSAIESGIQIVELDYDAGPYASAEKLSWHHSGPAVATPIAIDALHAGVILLARSESDGFAAEDLLLMRQIGEANRASITPLSESLDMTRNVHFETPVRSGDDAVVATAVSCPS